MNVILKFRIAILALIAAAQIFSPVLFVPGLESFGGSVFRLILIFLSAIILVTGWDRPISIWSKRALIAIGVLAIWMTISLAWSPDLQSGVRQSSYMVTIMLLIYVFDSLISDANDFFRFAKIIVWFGAGTIILSLYELETGQHFFRSSLQDTAETNLSLSYITDNQAWFTFGNPNDLAVHLALCCSVATLFIDNSMIKNLMIALYFASFAYLATALDAKLTILAVVAFALIWSFASLQKRAATASFMMKWVVFAGSIIVTSGLLWADRAEFLDVSTFIRLKLVTGAIEMASQTLGLGIGAGGFESEMWAGAYVGDTYGIINPHNAMGRVIAENGIIGLALFVFVLLGPIRALSQAGRATRLSAYVAGLTIGMPLLLSVGSDPMSSSSLQLGIAFLWIACRLAVETGKSEELEGTEVASNSRGPHIPHGLAS